MRWKWIVVLLLLMLLLMPAPVLADSSDGIVVTVTGWVGGDAPSGFTLTYINDYEVGISWTKGSPALLEPPGTVSTVVNTMIRVKWGVAPTSRTDGYQVYYGDGNSFSDTATDLTSLTSTPYYRAWSETVFYNVGGDIISSIWEITGTWKEANFMSISWLFAILGLLAFGLTFGLFLSRNAMLGFPSAIFWALFGGYSYSLSITTWDIYFMIAFASLLGMVTFCSLGAYGLKTKKEEAKEGDLYFDEGGDDDVKFIDEGGKGKDTRDELESDGEKPSSRIKGIRDRASKRRSRLD